MSAAPSSPDSRVAALLQGLDQGLPAAVARAVSLVENRDPAAPALLASLDRERIRQALFIGITGPPGAGKSSLCSRLVARLRARTLRVGVVAVDPSSPLTGGALLGDRVRMMEHALDPGVFSRSMACRGRLGGLSAAAGAAARIMAAAGCQVVLLETVGIGQSETDAALETDIPVLVLAPGFGDDIQAMKAGVLEVASLVVINKADLPGARRLEQDLRQGMGREMAARRLLCCSALRDQGVEALAGRLLDLGRDLRATGELSRRRARAWQAQTLELLMDLVRDRAAALVERRSRGMDQEMDPYVAARDLLAEVGFPGDGG